MRPLLFVRLGRVVPFLALTGLFLQLPGICAQDEVLATGSQPDTQTAPTALLPAPTSIDSAGAGIPTEAIAETKTASLAAPKEEETKISMDFKNTPIRDVLKILSQQSGLNFVTSKEAEPVRISIYLDQVSVHDAMESIAEANDLVYEKKLGSNIYIVYSASQNRAKSRSSSGASSQSSAPIDLPSPLPNLNQFGSALGLPTDFLNQSVGNQAQATEQIALETKVFFVKFKRLSSSPMDVGGRSVIQELSSVSSLGQGGTSSESASGTPATGATGGGGGEDSTGAEATRGIDQVIATLLSSGGKLSTDLHTNSLIVTDTADRLKVIEDVLLQLDIPARQVMLEVEIIEIKSTLLQDTGVDWGGNDGALIDFTGGSRTASFPLQEALFNSFDAKTGAKASVTLGTLSLSNFKATLKFLMSHQDSKILARPRVLTLNNEAAIIKLATNTSIAKVSEQSSSEGVSVTTTDTAERSETGIILKMTPQVNLDDTVELYLEPSISTVAASTFFANDFLDPTVRSVRTTVRVRNHETIVIGGLIDTDSSTTVQKFPLLGDLPFVGEAFRYTDKSDSDRELLIFISPHILREGNEKPLDDQPALEPRFIPKKEGPISNISVKNTVVQLSRDISQLRPSAPPLLLSQVGASPKPDES